MHKAVSVARHGDTSVHGYMHSHIWEAYYQQGSQEGINFAPLYRVTLGIKTGQGPVGNLTIHGREINLRP